MKWSKRETRNGTHVTDGWWGCVRFPGIRPWAKNNITASTTTMVYSI